LIKGFGSVQQTKKALNAFRAKARLAGHKGICLNVIDFGLPPGSGYFIKALGVDSVTSYVWCTKSNSTISPKPITRRQRSAIFEYWDAHHADCGVPHLPNTTVRWDRTPGLPASVNYDGKTRYPNTSTLSDNSPSKFQAALQEAYRRALTVNGFAYLSAIIAVFAPKLHTAVGGKF
jgi:hypothetical protein